MDPFFRALQRAKTVLTPPPSSKPTQQRPEKLDDWHPQSSDWHPNKMSDAALDRVKARDKQWQAYSEAHKLKLAKLEAEYPVLVEWRDALRKNDKTTTCIEGGILDTDFTERALALRLRDYPQPVRMAALNAFHTFVQRKNTQAGHSVFAAPMPWDDTNDVQVMKQLLRVT